MEVLRQLVFEMGLLFGRGARAGNFVHGATIYHKNTNVGIPIHKPSEDLTGPQKVVTKNGDSPDLVGGAL